MRAMLNSMIIHYEIPDRLHRALKMDAASRGWTLKETIIHYLAEGVFNTEPGVDPRTTTPTKDAKR